MGACPAGRHAAPAFATSRPQKQALAGTHLAGRCGLPASRLGRPGPSAAATGCPPGSCWQTAGMHGRIGPKWGQRLRRVRCIWWRACAAQAGLANTAAAAPAAARGPSFRAHACIAFGAAEGWSRRSTRCAGQEACHPASPTNLQIGNVPAKQFPRILSCPWVAAARLGQQPCLLRIPQRLQRGACTRGRAGRADGHPASDAVRSGQCRRPALALEACRLLAPGTTGPWAADQACHCAVPRASACHPPSEASLPVFSYSACGSSSRGRGSGGCR